MTFDEMERRAAESRRLSLDRLQNSLNISADAHWTAVAASARVYMGEHWNEFVEICAMASERPADPFMLRYVSPVTRPVFLAQVRGLLVQHHAMLRQGHL